METHRRSCGFAASDGVHYYPSRIFAIQLSPGRAAPGQSAQRAFDSHLGIAIVAQTAKPEAAYTALRGILHTMGPYVNVPDEREGVARLGQFRTDLQPEEVTAIQQSMEHGRVWPWDAAQSRAMWSMVEALVRGDDVASAVNQGCSTLYENQQA